MGGVDPATAMLVLSTGAEMIAAKRNANAANAANAAASAEAQSRIQQIQQAQQIRDSQKRERLRKTLAQQRSRFGARGIGRGGSADAVLRGLTNETERNIADQRGLNALSINDIQGDLQQRRQQNLLEASTRQRRAAFSLMKKGLGHIPLLEP
ncbi:MAG: hypothetical protein H8E39_00460 [Alphaproteobacteria bacterium]|nr:hypothetical protein [Alphaproteobacteria bacterium]